MSPKSRLLMLGWAWLAVVLILVACRAPVSLGRVSTPGTLASPGGYQGGTATLRIEVSWPRRIQSIPPSADRIVLSLQLPAGYPTPAPIPDLIESQGVLGTSRTVTVPAGVPVKFQATATANGAVVAQSQWLTIVGRRNQANDVPLELLPATGSSPTSATFLAPEIDQVTPNRGYPGLSTVTLFGANFGFSQGYGAVLFDNVDAGSAQTWTDNGSSVPDSATISVRVPADPAVTDGTIQVRLGASGTEMATYTGSSVAGDPWAGHFNVLGSIGATFSVATDVISDAPSVTGYATSSAQPHGMADMLLASNGSNFWAFWVGESASGATLEGETLTPDAQKFTHTVSAGTPFTIDSATLCGCASPDILLGGAVSDGTDIWVTWTEESGGAATVMLARVSTIGVVVGPIVVSTTAMPSTLAVYAGPPAVYTAAHPVLAINSAGTLLVVWIDDRDAQGSTPVPRVYGEPFGAGTGLSQAAASPVELDNSPGTNTFNVSQVALPAHPTVASDGQNFLVSWDEAGYGQSDFEIMSQGVNANGSLDAGGPGTVFENLNNLFDPQLGFASGYYALVYAGQPDNFADSSLYFQNLNALGQPYENGQTVSPITISDDSQAQGQVNCPSFTPGEPCGQGLRSSPQILWNGRDLMTAWEMDRNDGAVDAWGARLQPDGLRAPEEPGSPQLSVNGGQRSVAEMLYTFEPGEPAISEPGRQFRPRLAFAGDVELIGWLEPGTDPSHLTLMARLWR